MSLSASLESKVPYSIIFLYDPLYHVSPFVFGCICFICIVSPSVFGLLVYS